MIGCPICEESGVDRDGESCTCCNGRGSVQLNGCLRDYVGGELSEAINVLGMCDNGSLPEAGGLMDQSAWMISVWQQLRSDDAKLDAERWNNGE